MISQSEIHYRDSFFSSLSTLQFKPYELHLSHSIALSTQQNHGEDNFTVVQMTATDTLQKEGKMQKVKRLAVL